MKAVVIGGAGFIGSHLVDRLLADEATVDVVDDLSTGALANLADARLTATSGGGVLKIHNLDAASAETASLIGMRRPDVLFHLAAIPRRPSGTQALARSLAMTMSLLEAARDHAVPKVVVALPATALYGRPASRDLPLKEQPLEPRGLRGVIARATVDALAVHREVDAIEFTVLALSTVYGPRQRADGGVVAAFADAAAHGRPPSIAGDGRQTRDLLYVDDAVDAIARAGTRGSGLVVNVGTGQQTPVREIWNRLSGGNGPEPAKVAASPDDLQRFAVSPVRARIHLGWSPWTSVDEGLRLLTGSAAD